MKWIYVLTLIALSSLLGCQSNLQQDSSEAAGKTDEKGDAASKATFPLQATVDDSSTPIVATDLPIAADLQEERQANANVLFVEARLEEDGLWTFSVTVEHPDMGWEDYADGWDVVLPDGSVVKPDPDSSYTRLLLHPHENEQPFTRSQNGIEIPEEIDTVSVRAHDLVDGFGGREVIVDLSIKSGSNFEVIR